MALTGVEWPALAQALGEVPSGRDALTNDGGQLHLIASFRSGDGKLCREFSYLYTTEAPVVAIACVDQGEWRIAFALTVQQGTAGSAAAQLVTAVAVGTLAFELLAVLALAGPGKR